MIYLDNAATTMPFEAVLETFREVSSLCFGNAASNHGIGRKASHILENSRKKLLSLTKLEKTHNLLFTSGATEANNLAIKGVALQYQGRGKRIITTSYEHPSVLRAFEELEKRYQFDVVYLSPRQDGVIHPEDLAAALNQETILVSIMWVNNEIGTINDLAALKKVIADYPKCFFHVDVTQGLGKMEGDFASADLLSFSGHKFGGLKGTGGLFYKKGISFAPLCNGGDQEEGIRPGTVNVGGAASLAEALTISYQTMDDFSSRSKAFYSELYSFFSKIDGVVLNSFPLNASQTPFIINIGLTEKKASVVVEALSNQDIYVSSVSACSTKSHASYVIEALGKDQRIAENSIRISFGHTTSEEDIAHFEKAFEKTLKGVFSR